MWNESEAWLIAVARRLGPLANEVVFVGGAVLGLLVDDPLAAGVRATDDVDMIVDVSSRRGYDALSARLRQLGFQPDASEGAPLCRWIVDEVVVDVMPTSAAILGFTNRWYAEAMVTAVMRELAPDLDVRVATAPYFIAMKLEAFAGRGEGDFVASHDLEDVIAIVDGHATLVEEVEAAATPLREYLSDRLGVLLGDEAFLAALPGHLAGDAASQARRPLIVERLRRLAELAPNRPAS